MHRILGAACALALLAGCSGRNVQATSTALASAEAVASDLIALEQQVQASGGIVSPAELAALNNAVAAAQAGVTALTGNGAQAPTVFANITTALLEIEPFLPAVAAVIGALAAPAPSATPAPTPVFPAVVKLQTDMAALRAAA